MASVRSVNAPRFTLRPHFSFSPEHASAPKNGIPKLSWRERAMAHYPICQCYPWIRQQRAVDQSPPRKLLSAKHILSPPRRTSNSMGLYRTQGFLGSFSIERGPIHDTRGSDQETAHLRSPTFLSTIDGGRTIATFSDKRMIFCSGRLGGCCFLYTVRAK
jgi:hypothetical protein